MRTLGRVGWVSLAAAVWAAATVWAQGLLICRACGKEAREGRETCAHCGAALPKPRAEEAPPAPAPAAPDKAAQVVRAAAEVVADSLRQALECEPKEPQVALAYFQNALAAMRLVPEGRVPEKSAAAVLQGVERVMQTLSRGRLPCKKCSGTGKFRLDMSKVSADKGSKLVDGVACPACKGVGGFAGFRDVAKVKMAILQGRAEFERRQMVAGDVRVGRALVPKSLEGLLTNRQRALVMTGVPVPCKSCQLTGRQACTACRASGWVPCTASGCDDGVLRETQTATTRTAKRLNDEQVKRCPRCDGVGEIPCPTCRGQCSIACKTCDGSGHAPRCARCSATGLMVCPKCKSTGEVKGAPCPECKGEGEVLCTACRGEGATIR